MVLRQAFTRCQNRVPVLAVGHRGSFIAQWLQGEAGSVPASASWAPKVSLPAGLQSSRPTVGAAQEVARHSHLCTCLCFALPFARARSHFPLPEMTLPQLLA